MTAPWAPSEGDIAAARDAHLAFLCSLYCDEVVRTADGAALVYSELVDEPEWNHAAPVSLSASIIDDEARGWLAARHRLAAVTMGDATLEPRLVAAGWRRAFRHVWLFHPPNASAALAVPSGVEVRAIDRDEPLDPFMAAFDLAFAEGDDPAHEGYGPALERCRRGPREPVHYVAAAGGEPVGCATLVHDGRVGGLYNLGVVPAWRGRGIGRELTSRRIIDARRAGCSIVFLQTETQEVTRWQRGAGFVAGGFHEGWVEGPP